MTSTQTSRLVTALLWLVLLVTIVRLWVMPLPSSFWVDEMGTAFVVHYGGQHPSFAVAPQVPASIYYALPRWAEALFGFSEVSYRLPSLIAMLLALWLIARLAMRLLPPGAYWLVVSICLSLKLFNYEADDARPYALGTCFAAAGVLALVRWLDRARWLDGLVFVCFAALLWRVHLIFWPFYLLHAAYAAHRLWRRDTPVSWRQALLGFSLLGVALVPVLLQAVELNRQAKSHVVADLPSVRELFRTLHLPFVILCGLAAWLLQLLFRWMPRYRFVFNSSTVLILAWWLCQPLGLFAYSWLTGASVWVPRYLALALPGIALMSVWVGAAFLADRPKSWKLVGLIFAVVSLIINGQWTTPWPWHHNSNWRLAVERMNALTLDADTPVLCPSPFIEAHSPVWTPEYPLPGFLYSYLPVYPPKGHPYLLPFSSSAKSEAYGRELAAKILPQHRRFFIYGGDHNVRRWQHFLQRQPELAAWHSWVLGPFGDVEAVVFDRP